MQLQRNAELMISVFRRLQDFISNSAIVLLGSTPVKVGDFLGPEHLALGQNPFAKKIKKLTK
jgi:hypothetical protein